MNRLAKQYIMQPMQLLDLSQIPEEKIVEMGGADTTLKLLLKLARDRDFIKKIHQYMLEHPTIFLSLSIEQAGLLYEYALFVGKGTKENAEKMKTTIQTTFGEDQAEKFFSLADYFKQEAKQEGLKEGIEKGIEKGIEAISNLLKKGLISKEQAEKEIQSLKT